MDQFTAATRLRPEIEALATRPTLRVHVVGPAGSGKSALLAHLRGALAREGRATYTPTPDTRPGDVPAEAVLVVDDAHHLGTAAAELVRDRLADAAASVVLASRPWPRTELTREVERTLGSPPLLIDDVARQDLIAWAEAEAPDVPARCLDGLLAETGGTPWLLSYALECHGPACADPGHTQVRRALEAQVAHRVSGLPDPLRHALEQVALTGAASLPEAERREFVATAHATGLATRNGTLAPLVARAVRSLVPGHAGAEPTDGDSEVLAAWAAGDLDRAANLVEASLASGGAADWVADAGAAIWSARGLLATASEVYAVRPPTSPGSLAHAALAHRGAGLPERVEDPGGNTAGGAPGPGALPPSTLGVALRLLADGLGAAAAPGPVNGALDTLVRASELYTASGTQAPVVEAPAVVAATAALSAGDVETARSTIEAAIAGDQGGAAMRRRLLLWRSWVAMQAERAAEARAALAAAQQQPGLPAPRDQFLRHAIEAALAYRYSDLTTLEAAWRAARPTVRRVDPDLFTLLPLASLMTVAARLGDPEALASHLSRAVELLRRCGSPPLWSSPVWWAGIQQGILLNRPDSLAPYARDLVSAADHGAVPRTMAAAGGVWVSVLTGKVDADAVEEAARNLAGVGLAWDGARLASHGARRSEDRRVSAQLLSCARDLHPKEARPRPEAAPSLPGEDLSERELEVAALVVEGKTYAEIGQAIFISPRTVEHHVASIRRRLGAASRSEMIARLRAIVEPGPPDGGDEPRGGALVASGQPPMAAGRYAPSVTSGTR